MYKCGEAVEKTNLEKFEKKNDNFLINFLLSSD